MPVSWRNRAGFPVLRPLLLAVGAFAPGSQLSSPREHILARYPAHRGSCFQGVDVRARVRQNLLHAPEGRAIGTAECGMVCGMIRTENSVRRKGAKAGHGAISFFVLSVKGVPCTMLLGVDI